jgi:urease accessory protein
MSAMADCDFAANRSRGRIDLSVGRWGGLTRRRRVHESGSLRARFPASTSGELEVVLINTAGGMAGGDAFDIRIAVGEHSRLVLCTAAAEKIYRSLGPSTCVNITIAVEDGGMLAWLPQDTILFDRARLSRCIEIDLAPSAHLLFVESIVFGRSGMGEIVRSGELRDRWRVRRGGTLCYAEGVHLDGPISQSLGEAAVANCGAATATALIIPADAAVADAVRDLTGGMRGEMGVSAWNGQAVLRFCARDGADLRHDLACVITKLRAAPVPRLWIN